MGESRRRPAPLRAVPAEDEAADAAQAAELSRAAREAVRQPADPRIDRQLAWMGLAEEEPGAGGDGGPAEIVADERRDDARVSEPVMAEAAETGPNSAGLDDLRASVAALSALVERAEGRFRALAVVVAVEAVAIVLLAALFLTR